MESISKVKVVGNNGQISLGKEYAGRQVAVSKLEDGWKLTLTRPVPESLLEDPDVAAALARALKWAKSHPAASTDLNALARKLKQG